MQDATLVVAEIPEAELAAKPVYYRGAGLTNGAFIRVADGDRKLSQYEVQVMLASRGQPREDETPVPEATAEDFDAELVAGLLERLRQPERSIFRRRTDEEVLRILKALVRSDEGWVPSLGGLLALGTYPQQFFPELGVTFVVYPTVTLGEPGPRGERFLDQGRFDGPVPRLLEPVMAALRRNMKKRAVVRSLFREDLWEYPETAVRGRVPVVVYPFIVDVSREARPSRADRARSSSGRSARQPLRVSVSAAGHRLPSG